MQRVSEITITRQKIFFVTVYRSPSQNRKQFECFIVSLQMTFNQLQKERPHSVNITEDFNCRSSQWWAADVESPERTALDEIIETNSLSKLIDVPTNISGEGMSCIDLIITDTPNLFVESGVHPSLVNRCQHQKMSGKLNMTVPSPPPYKKTLWDYSKADTQSIRNTITELGWHSRFSGLGPEDMTEVFTNDLCFIFSSNNLKKFASFNDKDPHG